MDVEGATGVTGCALRLGPIVFLLQGGVTGQGGSIIDNNKGLGDDNDDDKGLLLEEEGLTAVAVRVVGTVRIMAVNNTFITLINGHERGFKDSRDVNDASSVSAGLAPCDRW